jgi:hypothetical protein
VGSMAITTTALIVVFVGSIFLAMVVLGQCWNENSTGSAQSLIIIMCNFQVTFFFLSSVRADKLELCLSVIQIWPYLVDSPHLQFVNWSILF